MKVISGGFPGVVFLVSLLLSGASHAYVFNNSANVNVCLAASGSSAVGWYCNSAYSQMAPSQWDGQVRFYNNTCLQANSSTSVSASPCSNTARQRWVHTSLRVGSRLYNELYGSSQLLYLYTGSVGSGVGMTNTYPSSPTRRWYKKY